MLETLLADPRTILFGIFSACLTALIKTIKFVHEGELGIKLRFGKAVCDSKGIPKVIKPGLLLLIPFVDSLQRRHVRQQTINFESQKIMVKGGLIFEVSAMVVFKVNDIYKALFEIDNLDAAIMDLCMGMLRDTLSPYEHDKLFDTKAISDSLLNDLTKVAKTWGVEFITFKLTNCAPTAETAQYVMAKTGAALKAAAIQAAAEEIGMDINSLNPALAAVMAGIPLVASVGTTSSRTEPRALSAAEKLTAAEKLLGEAKQEIRKD